MPYAVSRIKNLGAVSGVGLQNFVEFFIFSLDRKFYSF